MALCNCFANLAQPGDSSGSRSTPGTRISINIGGYTFKTARTTLTTNRAKGSLLEELVNGDCDSDGVYFLDRDGQYFHFVLNYLRDGTDSLFVPEDDQTRKVLLNEAKKLKLPELALFMEQLCGQSDAANHAPSAAPKKAPDEYKGAAPFPTNEATRLAKLRKLKVLDTQNQDTEYDAITRILAAILRVPMCLVSLVDEDRQWFKSKCGLGANETPRSVSFCAFTLLPERSDAASLFIVEDATRDPRFFKNPLVIGEPHIRFYAGCPLVDSQGFRYGALCVIDKVPKTLQKPQMQLLINFGQLTVQALERNHLLELQEEATTCDPDDISNDFTAGPLRAQRMKEALSEAVLLVWARPSSLDWPIVYANQTWTSMTGVQVIPPLSFPGHAELKAASGAKVGRSLWDFLKLASDATKQVREIMLQMSRKGSSQERSFSLSAFVDLIPSSQDTPSKSSRSKVSCRFVPASTPLDAGAGIIQPAAADLDSGDMNQMGPPGWAPGSWFFVVMAVDQNSKGVEELPQQGSEPVKKDSSPGNELSAMKPPRPPFEDVRLLRLVGQGSFGSVYFGLWIGAPVAVKIIKKLSTSGEQTAALKQDFEAALSASISHPNLVQTFKYGGRTNVPDDEKVAPGAQMHETWIVQEWCEGGTLGARCKEPRVDGQGLLDVFEIAIELSRAGAYLHDLGVIHGDLTPNNVLIKNQATRKGFMCKVCDFGLARVLEDETQEIITQTMGTVTHMPPELFSLQSDNCRLTKKADIYALGMILYQVVTAQAPYAGLSAPQIVIQVSRGKRLQLPEKVPKEISDAYSACVAKDPQDRPTFAEFSKQMLKMYNMYADSHNLDQCPS